MDAPARVVTLVLAMLRPELRQAFTHDEYERARRLLAEQVVSMLGRKLEEGDWINVYCLSKGIPVQAWSNLYPDVRHEGRAIEMKMIGSDMSLRELAGNSIMHPAATRRDRSSFSRHRPGQSQAGRARAVQASD